MEMKDAWTPRKAEETQGYADSNELENLFAAIKDVYGPIATGSAPLFDANGTTLHTCPPTSIITHCRGPGSPLPYSIASTHAAAAAVTTSTAHNPDTPLNINLVTGNTTDLDTTLTCPHCGLTFTSHIRLIGHLGIRRIETGETVPGEHTRQPHLPPLFALSRTFTHRMGLPGHMCIHNSGTNRSSDMPSISSMPSSAQIPPPTAPIAGNSTTTIITVVDSGTSGLF
nr:unnamed protein product [Spirometra erinaceieuropaei]